MIMYGEPERKAEKVVAACLRLEKYYELNPGPSKHDA